MLLSNNFTHLSQINRRKKRRRKETLLSYFQSRLFVMIPSRKSLELCFGGSADFPQMPAGRYPNVGRNSFPPGLVIISYTSEGVRKFSPKQASMQSTLQQLSNTLFSFEAPGVYVYIYIYIYNVFYVFCSSLFFVFVLVPVSFNGAVHQHIYT